MGGAHLVLHAAGWLGGGLTASFEKLIIDAEMLQMMAAYFEPLGGRCRQPGARGDPRGRPGRALFRRGPHARALRDAPSIAPLLSNWDNYDTWLRARRRSTARERANTIWKQLLAEYQQPPIDPAIDEALRDYMARRKREGGSPAN